MLPLKQFNSFSHDELVNAVDPVFEHSPWIADAARSKRPFASVEELHRTLCQTVVDAGEETGWAAR